MDTVQSQSALNVGSAKKVDNSPLPEQLKIISEKCNNCELCQQECAFLAKYGQPKEIADAFNPFESNHQDIAFECSLCRLCAAVCPVDIDPSEMFLAMRREAVSQGNGVFSEHAGLLKYEKRGTSKHYTWYGLPQGCDTILFPGCTLPHTRPDKTFKLYEYMQAQIPTLGIVLDCCTKPSHDLGRKAHFAAMFGEMKNFLIKNRIRNIYVACPNCFSVFSRCAKEFSVKTAYEFIAQNGLPSKAQVKQTVTIHDPCAVRFEEQIHFAVREMVERQGLTIAEMAHHGKKTICCGEGGAADLVASDLASNWGNLRKKETDGKKMMTYCAGCASFLNQLTPTIHILDLLFDPKNALAGKVQVAKAPLTYLSRIRLKSRFKKTVQAVVTRERTFTAFSQ